MCGIAGIIQKQKNDSITESIFAMSQAIKHRGPDGEGFVLFNNDVELPAYSKETPVVNINNSQFLFNPNKNLEQVSSNYNMAFAHRRLSIIDLSASGHQPMCDTTSNYWITFNGEIYNYIELKTELSSKGHNFITQTDTEVVLAAYKEWGVNCLQKFNGMWAFALYDKLKQTIFCARDRVGVKPFYYINNNNVFAFSSEQKAFIKSKLIPFEINELHQFNFLVNATIETESQSLFKDIYELKPSHYLNYNLNTHTFTETQYYSIQNKETNTLSEPEIIQTIEEKLINAINLRLRSDVKIGSCLSGGLDSSIIAGIIKHLQPNTSIPLFTATFPNETFDESNYAKQVSDFNNAQWHTVSPSDSDFFKDIETLNYFQDLPIWSTSTYSQYRVMQLASEAKINVLLDGQGADELFGGYTHHYFSLWNQLSFPSKIKNINESKNYLKNPYYNYSKQIIKEKLHLSVNYSDFFTNNYKKYGKSETTIFANTLNEQLEQDYFGRLKSFLKCEDRCSMAFGIESRVPFADDIELVNYLFTVKGNLKIKKGVSKYLLREATKAYIPNTIYSRTDKIGFEAPVYKWLVGHKSEVLNAIKQSLHNIIIISYLEKNYDGLLQQKTNFIFRLFSYSVWKKVYSQL